MAQIEKDKKGNEITYEELTLSNMWQIEAICRILVRKGIFSMEDFTNELKLIKKESRQ